MLQEWQTATVVNIVQQTSYTRSFFLKINNTEKFDFEPGQFITLDLPIHEQKNKRWRSYSIASNPDGTNIIELVIVLLEGGLGTTYLFNEVNIGTEITFRGAAGKFTLPQNIEKDICFICTGTGVAPFRSMLKHIQLHNIYHKNLYLIFGCRKAGDCLYKDELISLQSTLQNFHYIPCFSRENTNFDFAKKGYVHDAYLELLQSKKQDESIAPVSFYMCGWKNMIDEAKENILNFGYDKKDIHLELYG
jgi:ferredoxin-NADP reductase